jgi:hypothetical protein
LGLTCYNAKKGLQMLRQNRKDANAKVVGPIIYIWISIYCAHIQSNHIGLTCN